MISELCPMHVALCTDGVFPHSLGGMQRHSRLLAEHLASTGKVRVTVLHPHAEGVFDPALGIREVSVPPIDPDRFYLRELWRYSKRTARVLDELVPDVVLSQGFCVWQGMRTHRDRLILHPHGLEMFQGLTLREEFIGLPFRLILRHLVRNSSFVISLGGKLTPILQKLAHGSGCEVRVLPNATEVPASPAHYPSSNSPLRILFVGRFAHNKGLDLLMTVARRLEGEGLGARFRFELAGSGPLLAEYAAQGLPSNVRLMGKVDDDVLFELYRTCHALVLPTRFEGMPTVVLEAMAMAKPVIVSDVGASAELVGPSNGWLIPPGDVDALYIALMTFAACSASEREQLGIRGHALARSSFDWPSVTDRFIQLFQQVSQRSRIAS